MEKERERAGKGELVHVKLSLVATILAVSLFSRPPPSQLTNTNNVTIIYNGETTRMLVTGSKEDKDTHRKANSGT